MIRLRFRLRFTSRTSTRCNQKKQTIVFSQLSSPFVQLYLDFKLDLLHSTCFSLIPVSPIPPLGLLCRKKHPRDIKIIICVHFRKFGAIMCSSPNKFRRFLQHDVFFLVESPKVLLRVGSRALTMWALWKMQPMKSIQAITQTPGISIQL